MSKAKTVGLWVVTVLLAATFFMMGGSKLAGTAQQVEGFNRWGYPLWFMYVTGTIEATAAVLLLMPRMATVGAGLICGVMSGAVLTHVKSGEAQLVGAPIVLLVLAVIVGYGRRHQVVAPFNRFFAPGEAAAAPRA